MQEAIKVFDNEQTRLKELIYEEQNKLLETYIKKIEEQNKLLEQYKKDMLQIIQIDFSKIDTSIYTPKNGYTKNDIHKDYGKTKKDTRSIYDSYIISTKTFEQTARSPNHFNLCTSNIDINNYGVEITDHYNSPNCYPHPSVTASKSYQTEMNKINYLLPDKFITKIKNFHGQ